MRTSIALLALLAFLAFATALVAEATAPAGLLVNGVHNPLAIDRDAVRFTWRMEDAARGTSQTAYQIRVASSPRLLARPDFWDSGKIDSGQSASVEYAGKKLPPATRFWWDVRVWNESGAPADYSAPAFFDTGLAKDEWQARYIWDGTANMNNFAYFRKTFYLTGANKPTRAKVYVTAHNDYKLYLNGELLGRGPARGNPFVHGQYNSYDITKLLKNGANVFAAMGHWFGRWRDKNNLKGSNSGVNARPAFLLEARMDYPDGSTTTIATDESWKALANTAFTETNPDFNGSRASIKYDSRREPAGWKTAGFDDSSWAAATVVDCADYHLFAQMAPLQREQAELEPVSVTHANGAWSVAFDRCITGWPKLTMHANHPGDVVRVEYFQRTGRRNPAGWDQYTCQGGNETWHADFGRHTSFQELKITGYAGELTPADVRGMWAYCDADVAGRFHCSSQLLNDIYEMCEISARQNIQQAIISVSANREQAPWLADSWNIGNVLLYNHRDTTMLDKIIRDYAAQQRDDGFIPPCCPGYSDPRVFKNIPEWAMSWPMILWEQYLFSGDQTLLREMMPRVERLLAWLKQYQDPVNKLPNPPGWRISDWAGPALMPAGGHNIATACLYYENLRIASKIAAILNHPDKAADYAQQAAEIKTAINTHLLKDDHYLSRPDNDTYWTLASAWPLRFDIDPPGARQRILAAIERAGKPAIGGHGGDALYSGLFQAGAGEFAVRDLERYRPMLEQNKTCWESFVIAADYQPNHAWTAYPGYLFQKYILGIQPTSGGFATFDIRPETGGLTYAEGVVPTVKGDIVTRWEKTADGAFKLTLTVPPNTRARVYIPKSSKDATLTESGALLWERGHPARLPGILAVTEQAEFIQCDVESGAYAFTATPR